MKGEKYKGLKKNQQGKFIYSESKPARKLEAQCVSTFCKKKTKI